MNNKEHTLLCVLGKTACGKDSLVNKLCERTGLKQIISYTTRPRRVNEGNTHIFVNESDYEQMYQDGVIAAFTQIGEYKYWTTVDQLEDANVYIIDYEGIKTLRELSLPNIRLVSVYIHVPDDIREYRALEKRKDDKSKFRTRDFAERQQFRDMLKNADFDYAISNIDFAKAYSTLHWISQIEGCWKNKEDTTE
jgi:guanylate kinase